MAFEYPNKLADQIIQRWSSVPLAYSAPPARWAIDLAIETAFHAGLQVDEGRHLQFTLLVGSPEDVRNGSGWYDPVELQPSRPFSASELAKLAPATSWRHAYVCVGPGSGSVSDAAVSEFRIWGFLDIGKSWRSHFAAQKGSAKTPPELLTITSHEPGSLSIARSGTTLVKLAGGLSSTPEPSILDGGPVAERLRPVCDELSRAVWHELKFAGYEPDIEHYPASMYTKFLARLLYHLRDVTHGTALLMVPDGFKLTGEPISSALTIKYRVNTRYASVWSALVKYHARASERSYVEGATKDIPREPEVTRKARSLKFERDEAEEVLEQFVETIGRSGNVDGAIVITDRFELLGFGAEIRIDDRTQTLAHRAADRDGKKLSEKCIEEYGTRHRSSFRFAAKYANTIPFVLSQDGGIKTILYHDNKIIYWPGIGGAEHGI
jgi:hypothetical protein